MGIWDLITLFSLFFCMFEVCIITKSNKFIEAAGWEYSVNWWVSPLIPPKFWNPCFIPTYLPVDKNRSHQQYRITPSRYKGTQPSLNSSWLVSGESRDILLVLRTPGLCYFLFEWADSPQLHHPSPPCHQSCCWELLTVARASCTCWCPHATLQSMPPPPVTSLCRMWAELPRCSGPPCPFRAQTISTNATRR